MPTVVAKVLCFVCRSACATAWSHGLAPAAWSHGLAPASAAHCSSQPHVYTPKPECLRALHTYAGVCVLLKNKPLSQWLLCCCSSFTSVAAGALLNFGAALFAAAAGALVKVWLRCCSVSNLPVHLVTAVAGLHNVGGCCGHDVVSATMNKHTNCGVTPAASSCTAYILIELITCFLDGI